MHVFPELKKLERKYPKELVVIGVHSAKFTNEKDSDCIKEAVLRHDLEHPVVNDSEFTIFNAYGAKGWPHFTLVDPAGDIVGHASGEGNYEIFVRAIDATIKKFEDKIDRKDLTFSLEKSKVKDGPLAYPGKIIATPDRLFIADTKHHRVLVTDHSGKVQETIGGPMEGHKDGDFTAARFDEPQGILLRDSTLWVCDRENHSVREVDLKAKKVKTVAGTGKQGYARTGGEALQVAINSPWDLAIDGDRLFIAMAGRHQIWALQLSKGTLEPFSGSGREELADGPHGKAAFNQPSGLSIANGKMYVADSEVSGVREVDLEAAGGVRTIVGTGLFKFGDVDGAGDDVRLQHVLAVLWHQGKLFVADAYNHKIKTCDPATRTVKTFLGDGKKGREDGKAPRFYEPSGLAAAGDTLFIADTNNHLIRACDLKTGEVRTLEVR